MKECLSIMATRKRIGARLARHVTYPQRDRTIVREYKVRDTGTFREMTGIEKRRSPLPPRLGRNVNARNTEDGGHIIWEPLSCSSLSSWNRPDVRLLSSAPLATRSSLIPQILLARLTLVRVWTRRAYRASSTDGLGHSHSHGYVCGMKNFSLKGPSIFYHIFPILYSIN